MLSKSSVRMKFVIIFTALSAAVMSLGAFAYSRVQALQASTEVMASNVASVNQLAEMSAGLQKLRYLYALTYRGP